MEGGERGGYRVGKEMAISVKVRLRIAEVSKYCMFISSVTDVLVQCGGSSLAVHIPSHEASQAVQIVPALGQTFVHLVLNEFVVYVTNLMNYISFNLNLCQSVCMKW